MTDQPRTNPGSPEAHARGCTCDADLNNDGAFPPAGNDWWLDPQCPLHRSWFIRTRSDT